MTGVLVLDSQQTRDLVNMKEAIAAIETAYQELGAGRVQLIPRRHTVSPKKTMPGAHHFFYHMAAAVPALNTAVLRLNSRTLRVTEKAGAVRQELPGNHVGLIMLFDIETNELKAILHDHFLSPARVAATSALVAKYLARPDVAVMGLLGSGGQARAHALALCEVRPLKLIKVFSPSREHREALAREMSARLGKEVRAVNDPREAVEGSDLLVAATSANEPVFRGEWLAPGMHVISIRGTGDPYMAHGETDDITARRAGGIVVNSREQVKIDGAAGLLPLIEEGALSWADLHEVVELITGKYAGRTSEAEITVHYNNIGMGIQFAAIGAVIYQKARQLGIGTELPTELFVTRQGG